MNISGVNFTGGFIVSPAVDNQFNYVTALLHGDGASAGTNNTFLDSSTNNLTVTRNGNTTQGSFAPYSTLWSNYFNGSSYLTAGTTASNFLCTGSATGITATFEAWVYPTAYSTGGFVYNFSSVHSKGATYFNFGVRNGAVRFYWFDGATQKNVDSASTSDVPLNTWTNIVVTISGTTIKIYINGTLNTTSATYTGVATAGLNQSENIGIEGTTTYFSGYISNYRLTNTVVYSAAFTPPTAPLTAITGTALLICQSNRFVDNSTNNFAITISGSPAVQIFSPFGTTTQYDPNVNGGSAYFNGSTDYLSLPSNAAFAMGTGDFTIDMWANLSATGANDGVLIELRSSGATSTGFVLNARPSGIGYVLNFYTDGAANAGSTVLAFNTWNYLVVTRSGTTVRLFSNGILSATFTKGNNFSDTPSPTIGQSTLYSLSNITGYLSNFRIVKGTAVYTTNFTPPTIPVTAIANTSLLLNFTNAQIFGSAMTNNFITVGNAQVSTSIYKYGTGSIYLDGTGDWLSSPDNQTTAFGSGNFTVEGWIYLNNVSSTKGIIFGRGSNSFCLRVGQSYLGNVNGLGISRSGIADLEYCSFTFAISTWYHIAVVRSGTTIYFFVNGTQQTTQGSGGGSYTFAAPTSGFYIGCNNDTNEPYAGYIDEFRVTKGYARYTANFTAPTSQFPSTGPIPIYPPTVEYLVVAGGGGGGGKNTGGGGGAGGLRTATGFAIAPSTSYTVTVGAGGNGGTSPTQTRGSNGVDSVFSTITSTGGGGGAQGVPPNAPSASLNGSSGGSGGGGGGTDTGGGGTAGSGNTPSTSPSQGNNGGNANNGANGGGGGGAGAVGATATTGQGGAGGAGTASSISGSSVTYAGGGGGGGNSAGGAGGAGGGGIGGFGNPASAATAGTVNTGSGGGGAGGYETTISGGAGGSGTVIIRYPSSFNLASITTGSPSVTTTGGYNIYTWTSSGSITF